jgi:hypothetical protein
MFNSSPAIKEILALLQQKVSVVYTLYKNKNDKLNLLALDNQDLLAKIAGLEADKVALIQVVSQKTEESLNLATQVATLNSQYNTSEAARAYATQQKEALAAEVQNAKVALAAALATALAAAAEEAAEDLAEKEAEDTLHADIAALESQISDLFSQEFTEDVSSEVPVESSNEVLESSSIKESQLKRPKAINNI